MSNLNLKYTCLFGGGAIRGAAHVGVIKALNELGVVPDIYSGSSVGSIVAALWAIGYTYEEIEEIFLSVNFELFRDISLGFSQKFAFSKGDVFLNWFRELVEKKYYAESYDKGNNEPVCFKNIKNDLVIITTNINDFSCKEFSTFETPDFEIAMAVRISCCMPGLMRAVTFEDKLLVDGDLMKGKPMWSLSNNLKNSYNRILEIRLEGTFDGTDANPIEYVNGMYTCMTSCETDFVSSIYKDCDKYDYLVINTGNVIVVDFNYPQEKRMQIISEGYEQTMKYFKLFMPEKKRNLYKVYLSILDKLRDVQECMLRKKFAKVKVVVGELFIILAEYGKYVDANIYNSIVSFQKLLFSKLKFALLGYSYCVDKRLVLDNLDELIKQATLKVNELSEYLTQFTV